jgi:hypothetical protein
VPQTVSAPDRSREADGLCGGHRLAVLPCGALFLVFAPGQPDDEGVEDGQRDQAQGEVQGDAVELVADEGGQEGVHG